MATRTQRRSNAADDYLKAILALSGPEDSLVTSNALAERLRVRAASVTGMIQKLAAQRPAPVVYRKHAGVRLSAAGKRRAWELVRHHRLIELFLHDVLKYSWDEVHDEAELLEHVISERFEERVAALLGDPRIDPHGHVIPRRDGTADAAHESPLGAWPRGKAAVVASVADRDPLALRRLRKIGLGLGVAVRITKRHAGGSLTIRVGAATAEVRIGSALAQAIAVREADAG